MMAARDIRGVRKPAVASVAQRIIDGPGGDLTVRIYTPVGVGPFPLMMFFHGGGFVLCSLDSHDGLCRNLCSGAGCVVVSVDYRLAATRWTAAHAHVLHGDVSPLLLAGDSAGANFAAVTALRIRDEGGPRLCGQMLIYPVTDHHSADTPSMRANAVGYGLTRAAMAHYWGHYLNHAGQISHPHAAPLRAASLAGLATHPAGHCAIRSTARRRRILRRSTGARRCDGDHEALVRCQSWFLLFARRGRYCYRCR